MTKIVVSQLMSIEYDRDATLAASDEHIFCGHIDAYIEPNGSGIDQIYIDDRKGDVRKQLTDELERIGEKYRELAREVGSL